MKKMLLCVVILSHQLGATLNHPESFTQRLNNLDETVFKKGQPKGHNEFVLGGEFLYWKTYISGDAYALSHTSVSVPEFGAGAGLDTNQRANCVAFSYDPAFRIWAKYHLPRDQWGLEAVWTRLRSHADESITKTATLDIHTVWDTTNAMVATFASADMHEKLDVFDFNMTKLLVFSDFFNLKYYAGLRAARVYEDMTVTYTGTFANTALATETILIKNPFKGVGFDTGLKGMWTFGRGFGLYARGEVAVLWGNFAMALNETIAVAGNINKTYLVTTDHPVKPTIKANLVAEAGLNWSKEFSERVKLSVFFGWEFNYWPNQIMWHRCLTNDQNLTGGVAYVLQELGDLGFQGFNLGLTLAF